MILSLVRRDVRMLSLGLFCILGIVAGSWLIPWWSRMVRAERDMAREMRSQLLTATALLRGVKNVSDSARVLADRFLASEARLLLSGTMAAASAELARLLSDFGADAGVQLDVVQPLGDSLKVGPFVRVGVRTQLLGDVQGVMEMLRLIETDTVLLSVAFLTLTQADPLADDKRPEALRGEMIMQALFRPAKVP